jgi:hypothetical protein
MYLWLKGLTPAEMLVTLGFLPKTGLGRPIGLPLTLVELIDIFMSHSNMFLRRCQVNNENKRELLKDLRQNRPSKDFVFQLTLDTEKSDYLIQLVELDIIREKEKK